MILEYEVLKVPVNCSCGDASVSEAYGLFITYPLRIEDSLESIAAAANLSKDLLQRYNPGANFSAGSGLVYIPGRGLSGGVIAGISEGVVIGALLVVVAVSIVFYKKKKVKDKTRYDLLPLQAGINVDKSVEFSREELAKATNDFSIDHKIGEGGFGSVYYAELRGEKAAIKKMDMQATKEFLAELKVLTRVNHLNLVRLIGYCVEGSLFLVYEYIENDNLSQHLDGTGWDPLPWSTRVHIALDSARGLEYIHEHTVCVYIHRDIKSANILIDKNFRAKVADFGLTKLVEAGGLSLPTRLVGTFGYMAPEYAQYGDVSPKLDVYAFGFEEALDKPDPRDDLCKLVDPRLGDNYPLDSVCEVAELARACTRANPQLRPSMRSVVVALMSLSSLTEDWDVGASYENQALASLSPSDSLEYSDQTVEDFQR
ncbi:hypothetical protein RHMOL_Rhmol04G0077200 [Rhododendron molle]|uniref:Uncharacterized protein n=1 Tax=Rhododendron molle TaxID=49168 RepID=A0ACC0NYH8_RHOML|nr:hypothetical protein RHMOL_Rhmol04G0077200 [Rhododendron molle]